MSRGFRSARSRRTTCANSSSAEYVSQLGRDRYGSSYPYARAAARIVFGLSKTCVSGWAMTHRQQVVIPDIRSDPRVPLQLYLATFVRSMAMVPVGNPAVAAIGAYWATKHEATQSQIETLAAIADSAFIQTGS